MLFGKIDFWALVNLNELPDHKKSTSTRVNVYEATNQ